MLDLQTLTTRHEKTKTAMQNAGLDALVLNAGPSLVYLTGMHFHLSERPSVAFFTPQGAPVVIMAELESAKAKAVEFEMQLFTYGENPAEWSQVFAEAAQAAGISSGKVGVEQHFSDDAGCLAGIDKIIDQEPAVAVDIDRLQYFTFPLVLKFVTGDTHGIHQTDFQFTGDN